MNALASIQIDPVRLGAMPLVWRFANRVGILEAFEKYVPADRRERLPAASTLLIALCNVTLERFPLYKMGAWARERRLIDESLANCLNDDRVGRALDRLFNADRAALLTEMVLRAIREFGLSTDRVHNDSTTVTLTGQYRAYHRTRAAKPKRGHNKDHRPDLKQLLFSLSVTGDGAVPLYFKVWDGNVTDDRTHLKNWMALRGLLNRADFTYVADSKLCTRENMEFIDSEGGFFVTVLPKTRAEDKRFKDWVQDHTPQWQEVIRRPDPSRKFAPQHVYWTFDSPFLTSEGFRIVWVRSSQKEKLDAEARTHAIDKTDQDLSDLSEREFRSRDKLEAMLRELFAERGTGRFFHYQIESSVAEIYRQERKGRPGRDTRYRKIEKHRYRVTWSHNAEAIRYESRCDGIFPLVTNRRKDTTKEILQVYKFQPRLERRHSQLKSVYNVAPVFLKNPERIEALLFLYFVALLIDGLIERHVRAGMKERHLSSIPIYPENRACRRPTADKIYDLFRDVRLHRVSTPGKLQHIPDGLSEIQDQVIRILGLTRSQFFETPR
jgi:transposase